MDIKISQLPVYENAQTNGNDSMPIVDSVNGITKRISLSQLDTRWQALPPTGVNGQYLRKTSSGAEWATPNKSEVGLGNVDNTSDLNKPISTATQAALNNKANITQLALKQDKLPTGSDGQLLTLSGGSPVWQTFSLGAAPKEIATQTLAAASQISFLSSNGPMQLVTLNSSGGAVQLAFNAFGNGPAIGGEVRVLVGISDTNYPIIEVPEGADNVDEVVIPNGTLYLSKGTIAVFYYIGAIKRWIEASRQVISY